jgi:hypothetical protein
MPYYFATSGALLAAGLSLFLIETAPRRRAATIPVDAASVQ